MSERGREQSREAERKTVTEKEGKNTDSYFVNVDLARDIIARPNVSSNVYLD